MTDIIPTLAPRTRHSHPDSPTVRLWATVLASQGLAYQLDDTSLFVPTELADQAIAEILAYEAENEPMPLHQAQPDSSSPGLVIFALILMCMAGAEMLWPDMDWLGKGRAHAELIQHGEWWRCVTALFLHVDAGHLLSNLVALAVLTWLLSRTFGTGLVWLLFLWSGGIGNAINAWFHLPTHASIGASTGVFGLLGILACAARTNRAGHVYAALGFGLSFLALLGTGEGHVDLGAHAFGLMAGLGLGAVLAVLRLPAWASPVAGGMACILALLSWSMAWA